MLLAVMPDQSGLVCLAKLRRLRVITFAGCTALAAVPRKANAMAIIATVKQRTKGGALSPELIT